MVRLVISTFCVSLLIALSARAAEIQIGGLRKVQATVSRGPSGVICKVSFIPVSCFDSAMNRMVNQQKARVYALLAMAKDLGLKEGTVSAPNLHTITEPVMEGGRLTATYQADDIRQTVESKEVSEQAPQKSVVSKQVTAGVEAYGTNLLSCLDDMRATLQTIESTFAEQTTQLNSDNSLEDAVAVLENTAINAYDKISKEVKDQKLLLQIEKNDLLAEIIRSRDALLKNLTKAYTSLKNGKNQL